MVNEDIVTALKNAIDHGDTLDSAKQIMISSGYPPREVQEASQFIGGGVITSQQQTPQEALTMPNQKPPITSKLKFWGKKKPLVSPIAQTQTVPTTPLAIPIQQTRQQAVQTTQQIRQPVQQQRTPQVIQTTQQIRQPVQQITQKPISPQAQQRFKLPLQSSPTQKQLQKIAPKKQGHGKEIMLLVILLVLIGLLITTIVMKNTILGWFSG